MEGQALRDRAEDFERADCRVIGLSFDTPAENKAFADAQQFGFTLLSDVDGQVGRRYRVLRDADDQYAAFPQRISYLVDPAGTIRRTYPVSDVGGHAEEVLRDLAELRSAR